MERIRKIIALKRELRYYYKEILRALHASERIV